MRPRKWLRAARRLREVGWQKFWLQGVLSEDHTQDLIDTIAGWEGDPHTAVLISDAAHRSVLHLDRALGQDREPAQVGELRGTMRLEVQAYRDSVERLELAMRDHASHSDGSRQEAAQTALTSYLHAAKRLIEQSGIDPTWSSKL